MAEAEPDSMMDRPDRPPTEEPRGEDAMTPRPDSPQPAPILSRKRPRLDLTTEPRKRGKTMFGILVGTLNKAKDEDAQRSKSEAVRRRMSLETKLQSKLALEQSELRRQGDIKRARSLASRKEDDLAIHDNVLRLSLTIKPYLSHFLTTSDAIPLQPTESLLPIPMSVAPPVATQTVLYYLPAVLLPEQEGVLRRRREVIRTQVDDEEMAWKEERKQGIEEVDVLRRQAEELVAKVGATEEEGGQATSAHEDSVPPALPEPPADPILTSQKVEPGDAEEEALEY